jgi:hypothetical protein
LSAGEKERGEKGNGTAADAFLWRLDGTVERKRGQGVV